MSNMSTKGNVEFVSYDGRWPNLCDGVLGLRINNETLYFGSLKPLGRFWESGGSCSLRANEASVTYGEWQINADELPERFRQYADEIAEVFNDNVPKGCCGGCI